MNQVRILIAESGSGYGGTAKYLASLLSLLDRSRFGVSVLSYGDGPFIQQIKRDGSVVDFSPSWRFPWLENRVLGIFQLALLVPRITGWLRRRKIQLVHLNNEIYSHLPLLLAARLSGARVLCHLHGWRPVTKIEKLFASWVDVYVSISEAGAQFYQKELNREVIAVPNGLVLSDVPQDLEFRRQKMRRELGFKDDQVLVSLVGRLVPWKGQPIFLKALAKAIVENPAVKGLILGRDESAGEIYLSKLKARVEKLGIQDRVHFLSWREDVWSIYAASDILVHASIEPEPFGLVALEAMCAGKPVIATRGGGMVDIVKDRETGILVTPNHVDEMAGALLKLASDSNLAAEFGEKGRERARTSFNMKRNAEQITEIYDVMLNVPLQKALSLRGARSLARHCEEAEGRRSNLRARDRLRNLRDCFAPAGLAMTALFDLKKAVKQTLYQTGTLRVLRRAVGSKVPILMYHRILAEPDPFLPSMTLDTFREQMIYIKRCYHVLSMDELVAQWKSGFGVPAKSVVLTLDDGDAATWSLAYPILHQLKIPVTLFLTTGPIDKRSFIWTDLLRLWLKRTRVENCSLVFEGKLFLWPLTTLGERIRAAGEIAVKLKGLSNSDREEALQRLEEALCVQQTEDSGMLTWEQVRDMPSGQVTVGAHTQTHAILSRLPLEHAREEILTSKKRLEDQTKREVRHFAYPNGESGDFTVEHEKMVAEAGFDSACTSILGLNNPSTNRYALRRVYAKEEPLASFATRLVGLGS